MSTYFRPQSQYIALFFCVIVIALVHRISQPQPPAEPQPIPPREVQQRQIQSQAIEGAVSGAIGIDQSRGDSVYVVIKR